VLHGQTVVGALQLADANYEPESKALDASALILIDNQKQLSIITVTLPKD